MPQQFVITAGDRSTRFQLPSGFVSVKVDNPTAQWVHPLDTYDYVPPGAMGYVLNIDGQPGPGAEWAAPPGVTQPAAVTGQQAALTYYEAALSPTAGTVIQVTASGTVNVGNSPTIAGINSTVTVSATQVYEANCTDTTGTGTTTLTGINGGAQALAFQIADTTKIAHLKVVGAETSVVYLELYYFAQGIYAVPFLSALDGQVNVTVQSTGAGVSAGVKVVALLDSVPEFLQLYAPPQLSANQPPQPFSASIAVAGAPVALITEGTNIGLWLFPAIFTGSGGSPISFELWQGTAGTPKQTKVGSYVFASNVSTIPIPFAGTPLTRGLGLYLNNPNGSTTAIVSGHLNYSKG